jgi:hypothetical protein
MRLAWRQLCTSNITKTLPVLRLPAMVFPGQCVSVPIVESTAHYRPPHGSMTPSLVDEVAQAHGGKMALLADGLDVGCIVDVRGAHGSDRELPSTLSGVRTAAEGDVLHMLGGERVQLLETRERTASGGRLASLECVEDEELYTHELRFLQDEAVAAQALLAELGCLSGGRGGSGENWSLELCTLDEEVMGELICRADPTAHPLFLDCAAVPEEATALAHWLACRLPLTTAFRLHLLRLTCPLKRMRDVVDALRLLSSPQNADERRFGKFQLLWQTAEASGCEVEAPKCVIHWRGEAEGDAISRY